MSGIIQVVGVLLATVSLTACVSVTPHDARLSGPSAVDLTHMMVAPGAPIITARSEGEAADAAQRAVRYAKSRLPEARGVRRLQISEIPYLRRSPEGADFLSQPIPRALARGTPAEKCPAAASTPKGAESTIVAIRNAVEACFMRLKSRGADTSCGCQVLAVDNALVAPRVNFSFAPGVTAFLIRDGDSLIQRFVAESEPTVNGGESVLLRTADGVVGAVTLGPETAEMRLAAAPDILWTGERRFFGYRRGRLSERISFRSEDGRSIRLLIGVETRDVVAAR